MHISKLYNTWEIFPKVMITFLIIKFSYQIVKKYYHKYRIKQQTNDIRERFLLKRQHDNENYLDISYLEDDIYKKIEKNSYSACVLIEMMKTGKLKSQDVLKYYINKTILSNEKYNCVTYYNFNEGFKIAEKLDKLVETGNIDNLGLLHGLPVSIKDCINIQGLPSTLGLFKNINKAELDDAVLVKLIKSEGGIPFVKTNVSQTMLNCECNNPMFGRTLNVYDKNKTSGGSSGGEAVLIKSGASPLGVGTDIGGSIRIPCHFNGIVGLKPTYGRLSMKGFKTSMSGQNAIKGCAGPMGKTVDDLVLMMKVWCKPEMNRHDPTITPLMFRDDIYLSKNKLKIGYYFTDDWFLPTLSCRNAVVKALNILYEKGHTLINFHPFDVKKILPEVYYGICSSDGGNQVFDFIEDEPMIDELETFKFRITLPKFLKNILIKILNLPYINKPLTASIIKNVGLKTINQLWLLHKRQKQYQNEFIELMKHKNIDIIICPALGFPAFQHGFSKYVTPGLSYTMLYNLLDLPAGVVPMKHIDEDDLLEPLNKENNEWFEHVNKIDQDSIGLPVGVQIVGFPCQEELVLRVMKELYDKKI